MRRGVEEGLECREHQQHRIIRIRRRRSRSRCTNTRSTANPPPIPNNNKRDTDNIVAFAIGGQEARGCPIMYKEEGEGEGEQGEEEEQWGDFDTAKLMHTPVTAKTRQG